VYLRTACHAVELRCGVLWNFAVSFAVEMSLGSAVELRGEFRCGNVPGICCGTSLWVLLWNFAAECCGNVAAECCGTSR
jgi:hypothetical protein